MTKLCGKEWSTDPRKGRRKKVLVVGTTQSFGVRRQRKRILEGALGAENRRLAIAKTIATARKTLELTSLRRLKTLARFGELRDAEVEFEKRFLSLAILWKYSQGPSSSIESMILHPAYLQVIGLGRRAVPFILEELRREPDHWFAALTAITGADPVPASARGNLQRMRDAWLEWGRRHGQLR